MINLFLAFFWLILGSVLLYRFYFGEGDRMHLTILQTRISLGWLALLLAFYNVARWWGQRLTDRDRQAIARAAVHPHPPHEQSDDSPNPDFDFNKPSSPTDRPPSPN